MAKKNPNVEYVGNHPWHIAQGYKHREYTHFEIVKGREVLYFDCFRQNPTLPKMERNKLNKRWVKDMDRKIRGL